MPVAFVFPGQGSQAVGMGQALAQAYPEARAVLDEADAAPAVDRAISKSKERGAKRALPLPVSAPFHCSLMAPVQPRLAEVLGTIPLRQPAAPVVANVTAEPNTDPTRIVQLLLSQVTAPVRWV